MRVFVPIIIKCADMRKELSQDFGKLHGMSKILAHRHAAHTVKQQSKHLKHIKAFKHSDLMIGTEVTSVAQPTK